MRDDIQSLRCFAVLFVLCFHLWEFVFPVGYLGVDIFFVISGYLMSTILSNKMPIDLSKILDFYFRRIRRIVPMALGTVGIVLLVANLLISPFEYPQLLSDGIYSSVFVSNFLGLHNEVGLGLIFLSLLLGYCLEWGFKRLCSTITSWLRLLAVLFGCLMFVGSGLFALSFRLPSLSYESALNSAEISATRSLAWALYNGQYNITSESEAADVNIRNYVYSRNFYSCSNSSRWLPTDYDANLDLFSSFCHEKGNGNESVVVIGNSHARALLPGIQQHLDYADLTLFVRDYCMPFMSKHSEGYMKVTCKEYEKILLPLLRHWKTPIDVIIVGVEYFEFFDPPFNNPDDDEYLKAMRSFYRALSSIARRAVIIPHIQMDWMAEPFPQILQSRLFFQKDFTMFEQTLSEHNHLLVNTAKRLELISCTGCRKIRWEEVWCNEWQCRSFDSQRISYFRDARHVGLYGSFKYGELLRRALLTV